MGRLLVARGFTAEFIQKKAAIAPTSASPKICSDMAGGLLGRTTAASSTTAPRLLPGGNRWRSGGIWSWGRTAIHAAWRRSGMALCSQRIEGRSIAHALRAAGIGDQE